MKNNKYLLIKQLHSLGKNNCQISRELGIPRTTIRDILNHENIRDREIQQYRNYSEDDIKKAISSSISLAETLRKLKLKPAGGNYKTINLAIARLNLDISHFKKQGWNKDTFTIPLDFKVSITGIKKHLIFIRGHKCEKCKNESWNGIPITLELDHIDGNRYDHSIINLRLLCPNCHSQTNTWRGRNRRGRNRKCITPIFSKEAIKIEKVEKIKKARIKRSNFCICGIKINLKSKQCTLCYLKNQERITWPINEELAKLVWEKPRSILAKELGISDKAIAKRCKLRNIPQPSRGYWAKLKNY